jgi:hypothetical protein
VFEEIQVSFMLVGHTLDNIDASFGRWSMKLRENDYPTILLLMKPYMDLDEDPIIPGFIEEDPNFKDDKWLPAEGIYLWKVDSLGMARLPSGVLKAVMPRHMKGHDIVKGLNGYIQYWIHEGQKNITSMY